MQRYTLPILVKDNPAGKRHRTHSETNGFSKVLMFFELEPKEAARAEISDSLGFSDTTAMINMFRRFENVSPAKFRKSQRKEG